MTVLYVTASSAPNPLLLGLVRELQPDTVQYIAATLDGGGPIDELLSPLGVGVHHLGLGPRPASTRAVAAVRQLLVDVAPDVIHSNMFWPGALVEVARRTVPEGPSSVFTRHHDVFHHIAGARIHAAIDGWTARRATVVIAPTDAVLQTLVSRERVPKEGVRVVPHAVDWDALLAEADLADGWRARFPPGRLAVAAARLDPWKDHPNLLRAVALARVRFPDLHLVIVGEAMPGVAEGLRSLAAELGISDALHLPGWQPHVAGLLAAADVVVQASQTESFGMTALEAAGLGVPLAMTTPGGMREVVPQSHPTIEPGDVESLAARIVSVLSDPRTARAVAAADALDVRRRFTLSEMGSGHAAAYAAAVGGAPRTREPAG